MTSYSSCDQFALLEMTITDEKIIMITYFWLLNCCYQDILKSHLKVWRVTSNFDFLDASHRCHQSKKPVVKINCGRPSDFAFGAATRLLLQMILHITKWWLSTPWGLRSTDFIPKVLECAKRRSHWQPMDLSSTFQRGEKAKLRHGILDFCHNSPLKSSFRPSR